VTLCRLQKDIKGQNKQLQQKIAELKRSEEALNDARANLEIRVKERTKQLDIYRKIISTSNEHFSFIDTDYRYQFINDTYKKNFNLSDEMIIGKTPAALFGEKRFNLEIKPSLDRCLSGKKINYQFKRFLTDTNYQIMDVFMYPYLDEDSITTGCVVTTRDITEQKKNEDMINQAYTELDQIFNSAGDGMYLIDKNFCIIRANIAFHKMWNASKDGLLGKNAMIFFLMIYVTPVNAILNDFWQEKNAWNLIILQFLMTVQKNIFQ